MREVGKKINRDHSVVSREVKRNKGPDNIYQPSLAHKIAQQRKYETNSANPLKHPRILKYAKAKLQLGWSPEQISGRIKLDLIPYSISPEAIYQYIYKKENQGLTLWVFLRRKRSRRYCKHGRGIKKTFITNRVFIDERPRKCLGYLTPNEVFYKELGGAFRS